MQIVIRFILTTIIFLFIAHQSVWAGKPEKLTLSLNEAILLAVRNNPNVQQAQLTYVSQKFNLYVQQWEFKPHYSFDISNTQVRTNNPNQPLVSSHNWNVQPGVSLLSPIGTQISLTGVNGQTGDYNNLGLSVTVMQPLMRGFGRAIVESALNNAKDSEFISRLNVESALRSTVTSVVNAYLDIVNVERTIQIDNDAVKRSQESVAQTKLFIKAGHKAGNELITVQANVASARAQLENDKNYLTQARYAMLAAIGVDPNTDIAFSSLDIDALIKKYHTPSLIMAKKSILQNDIQYKTDQITLHGSTSRSVLLAEDNSRWQLNLSANAIRGGETAYELFNVASVSEGIGLTLKIPIDDQTNKQAVMNAKISLKQAELALLQEKWSKETSIINNWNSVKSAEHALSFAQDAEKLQVKTYQMSYQKYLHGLIDSLELQTAQIQLIQSQQVLLNARIGYLKALVNVDYLIGNTLNTWNVKVRL